MASTSNRDSDSTDDSSKRRRNSDVLEDQPFEKSRKTARTPTKQTKEDKLDRILELMQNMKMEMIDMKHDMKELRKEQKEFREVVNYLKWENKQLNSKYENVLEENGAIRKELAEIKRNLEWVEKEKRQNNVVLTGLTIDTIDPNELRNAMMNFIDKNLDTQVQVKAARKLGARTCLIELHNEEDKEKIMQNKQKLRNMGNKRIYITTAR